jgi:IMP dehydrogenase
VIHKNLSVEAQALEAEKVKKYESGMIMDPITLEPDRPVSAALEIMRRYSISGVPITVGGVLVGILTNRDLRFETNVSQPISAVMTKDQLITAEVGTTLDQAKLILQRHRIEKLPVVDRAGKLKGLITIKDIEKAQAFPNATKDAPPPLVSTKHRATVSRRWPRWGPTLSSSTRLTVTRKTCSRWWSGLRRTTKTSLSAPATS